MLTLRTLFVLHVMAIRYAESAFRDACRTSSGGREGVGDYTNHSMKWQSKEVHYVYADLMLCTNSILAVEYASCRENLKELLNHKQSQYEEG